MKVKYLVLYVVKYRTTISLEDHMKAEHDASQSKPSGKTQKCNVGKTYEEQLAELGRYDYPRVRK